MICGSGRNRSPPDTPVHRATRTGSVRSKPTPKSSSSIDLQSNNSAAPPQWNTIDNVSTVGRDSTSPSLQVGFPLNSWSPAASSPSVHYVSTTTPISASHPVEPRCSASDCGPSGTSPLMQVSDDLTRSSSTLVSLHSSLSHLDNPVQSSTVAKPTPRTRRWLHTLKSRLKHSKRSPKVRGDVKPH